MKGMFITVEGSEGAGKSTNLEFIQERLQAAGKELVMTREPGGTELGEEIRELLLGHKHDGMSDDCELLLMFAARAEHLNRVIKPALNKGKWVVCDRFTDATYAYQGGGRGIPMQRIEALENWVQGELRPDLTLFLDVPVDIGMKRAGERSAPDRFERQQIDFFERVRTCYLERARSDAVRYRIIDAGQSLEDVQRDIAKVLTKVLE
ncbi:MAG: dTMP kinase [Gammaproteobacteria bacterium]|nr:dTMP kinase [Gammaproteobacteria bacterium]MCK5091289.1 dTMP kinase [Gammaproteobacteria bacterium]